MMISNTQELLDYIYERQKIKFPNQSREQTTRKLRAEIIELQEANRLYWMTGSKEHAEAIKFEEADVIIMANRLYQDFQDELAWAILSKYYNYESAKYVKMKWDIVEQRTYKKDANGNYQHEKGEKNEFKRF